MCLQTSGLGIYVHFITTNTTKRENLGEVCSKHTVIMAGFCARCTYIYLPQTQTYSVLHSLHTGQCANGGTVCSVCYRVSQFRF